MIIDFHVHIFPPKMKEDRSPYLAQDPGFRNMYQDPRSRLATVEDLIVSMDRAGVDRSVVQGFSWRSQDLCHETNDYIQEAAARFPQRIIPFCIVQPLAGEAAVMEVRRCTQQAVPARGIGELRPEEQGYLLEVETVLRPIYEVSALEGLILLLHASEPVGHAYPGKGRMTPDLLYRLAASFPDWPMVLAHLGGGLPFYAAMPEVREALAQVYVDTAAWPLLYRPEVFSVMTDIFGAEKVLFGTDFPLQDQTLSLKRISELSIPSEALDMMLGGNAARLLRLPSD